MPDGTGMLQWKYLDVVDSFSAEAKFSLEKITEEEYKFKPFGLIKEIIETCGLTEYNLKMLELK